MGSSPRFDPRQMPADSLGGAPLGRLALQTAIGELRRGAGERGGNNRGPDVIRYFGDASMEGQPWCAAFVTWCVRQHEPSFPRLFGARALLTHCRTRYESVETSLAGDLIFWWRQSPASWKGHVGIVHHAAEGWVHTIEGNRGPRVAGYSYRLGNVPQLLGLTRLVEPE